MIDNPIKKESKDSVTIKGLCSIFSITTLTVKFPSFSLNFLVTKQINDIKANLLDSFPEENAPVEKFLT